MNNFCVCENCKHFILPEGMADGVCCTFETNTLYVSPTYSCKHFEPRPHKVKPRRLCDFCERRRPIDDDYGRYTMEFTKLIPLESINLTTRERTEPKNKFSYSLFVYDDADDGEVGSFPIKYCPLCGRKLDGDGEK